MLRNLSEKLGAKFPSTTFDYSVVRIFRLYAFLEIFELQRSPEEGQPLQRKDKKREKKERENKIKK